MFLSGQHSAWRTLRSWAAANALSAFFAVVSFSVLVCVPASAWARQTGLASATVQLSTLPFEAQSTYRMVFRGGPFPYSKDGVVFFNRERALPAESRGFYREYTVRTPGSADRGARRIVCGGKVATKPETCYYTHDHYSSFQRIVQ